MVRIDKLWEEHKKSKKKPKKEINLTKDCDDWKSAKYLGNKDLFKIIIKELSGNIAGEEKSIRSIFLSLCSIWVKGSEVPLNTLVSSESSSGKSFTCKNIIKIFPRELVVYRTKITPEAFTYFKSDVPDWNWNGKIFYLEDISQTILDSPTFKVMCSEGSKSTVVRKQLPVDIDIAGKPTMLITTARTNPNTEMLNRFQIVQLDESKEQNERIIRHIAKATINKGINSHITKALRKLERVEVNIPFAEEIAEYLIENYDLNSVKIRRDFPRLIDLIKCSTALHQFQRITDKQGRIVAQEEDFIIAREIINYVQKNSFKGLTHRLKKAFDCCKQFDKMFTAKEIHSKFPIVTLKIWYKYLDQFLERGLLKTELGVEEGVKQKVNFYYVNETEIFELPEFHDLFSRKSKKVKIDIIDKKDKKDTIDKDNSQNNCINYNNCIAQSTIKQIKPSEI